MPAEWKVERVSGRWGDDWRAVGPKHGESEEKANKRYLALFGKLRQGGVRLVDPAGEVRAMATAPRLRTRW